VPGGRGGGMPGSWGWAGLAFALFPGPDLAIQRHAPSLTQEVVDAEPGVPEAGVGHADCVFLVSLRFANMVAATPSNMCYALGSLA
jgi:hypothetical protein